MSTKINIQPLNADGVHEMFVIATALKNAKHFVDDNNGSAADLQIEEALAVVEKIIDDGLSNM